MQAAGDDGATDAPADVRFPRTYLVMLAAAVGLGLGVLLVYFDYSSWSPQVHAFARTGPSLFWLGLICAQTMLWTVALPPLAGTFRRHWRTRTPASVLGEVVPSAIVLTLLVAAVAAVPRLIKQVPEVIPRQHAKTLALMGLALLVALIASMAIWLIRGRAETLGRNPTVRSELQAYLRLRADLELLLGFLGAVIALAVLASAELRHAYLSLPNSKQANFPPEAVVLYGLVLSFLVALIYLPTFATLQRTGATVPKGCQSQTIRCLRHDWRSEKRSMSCLSFRFQRAPASARASRFSPLLASLASLLPGLGG